MTEGAVGAIIPPFNSELSDVRESYRMRRRASFYFVVFFSVHLRQGETNWQLATKTKTKTALECAVGNEKREMVPCFEHRIT